MEKITRARILLECMLVMIALFIVTTFASLMYLQFSYIPEPNVDWEPVKDFKGILTLMPVGIIFHLFIPWGWPCWIGLILSLYYKKRVFYAISAFGAVTFGISWPKLFWAWMSV